MATTTNYGWTTPDDTALVKDGAAAIRTLGTSVDTTTKNLNPSTTLGDIEYRSSTANTNTRLGIGSTGQVLTVAAGVPSWATPSSGGMTLLNAGGTTLTGSSITISSIPATYNDLRIIVRNFRPATDNSAMVLRINGDAGGSRHKTTSAISEDAASFNTEYITITRGSDNGASNNLTATTIYDYANTTTFKICQTHASITPNSSTPANINMLINHGYYNQTTAISSLEFRCDSGNFTSGTVFVYGVK
jgi:hypothetical protein